MDIFVSWAGPDSHAVALVLRRWLPHVLSFVRPWVSSEDIRKGTRWSDELWARLQETSDCLVCLTPGAVRSPWVNFEAGAVARAVGGQAHVSPILLGSSPGDLGGKPLAMFQCTEFTRRDIERLIKAINAVAVTPLPESEVLRRFRRQWATLRDEIGRIHIASADDSEEAKALGAEAPNDQVHPIEDSILEQVAGSDDDWPLDVEEIARTISQNRVVTRHYVDELIRRGFLREKRSAESPSTYTETSTGRAYLVERGLV
ncbi:MAG: toll/interleukin-1 receptor domain-containing protein [Gammaproteobacteria bacterium]|nr:toll/interleukin-1 receptor domain-containing protein [Gammaproteobacteria bacterium]